MPGWFDGKRFLPSAKRLPGMVSVLNNCNSMIILARDLEHISKDGMVKIIPINWKFFAKERVDFFN